VQFVRENHLLRIVCLLQAFFPHNTVGVGDPSDFFLLPILMPQVFILEEVNYKPLRKLIFPLPSVGTFSLPKAILPQRLSLLTSPHFGTGAGG